MVFFYIHPYTFPNIFYIYKKKKAGTHMEINQKPFFEREGNQIRFRSTKTITWNQWNKIFNKLNHLNYGFPDIDSVKDYFDRGNWLMLYNKN